MWTSVIARRRCVALPTMAATNEFDSLMQTVGDEEADGHRDEAEWVEVEHGRISEVWQERWLS